MSTKRFAYKTIKGFTEREAVSHLLVLLLFYICTTIFCCQFFGRNLNTYKLGPKYHKIKFLCFVWCPPFLMSTFLRKLYQTIPKQNFVWRMDVFVASMWLVLAQDIKKQGQQKMVNNAYILKIIFFVLLITNCLSFKSFFGKLTPVKTTVIFLR